MSQPIAVNHLKNPYPKAQYALPGLLCYRQYNGYLGPGPETVRVGATQLYNVGAVPADLSTLILNAPNGQNYAFQFVYNSSVQTTGIKVPLPLSGASTAAQTTTALLNILNGGSGTPFGGSLVTFPFLAPQTGAAQFRIDWRMNGLAVAATGTQGTIIPSTVIASSLGSVASVPGSAGRVFAFLRTA